MGAPDRESQEYSRNILEYKDLGRCIPKTLLLHSWVPCLEFTVHIRVPVLGFRRKSLPKKNRGSVTSRRPIR